MAHPVGIGMLGSGFIAGFYTDGLRYVPDVRLVADYGQGAERREAFALERGFERSYGSIAELCADPEVDLVVVALPNHLHLEAVREASRRGKAVVCTKPLGRNAQEAAEMMRLATEAGIMHGYLENVVFGAEIMRIREMVEAGAIGDLVGLRAREGHSGPHAPHFWDAETAGGGALLDMGPHTIETARFVFGKDRAIRDVFAWGATLVHGERTTGEDNALVVMRFEDGRTAITDVSWSAKGGLEGRTEVYGTKGKIIHDTTSTPLRAFIEEPAGYLAEKADAETGWVFPVPDETRAHGYDEQMRHMVESYRAGTQPRETFLDGYVVNCVLDAAYRSMKSGRWESVELDAALLGAGAGRVAA